MKWLWLIFYQIQAKVSSHLKIYHRLSLEMHKQMIQTLSKSLMAALESKLQLQGFFWTNF